MFKKSLAVFLSIVLMFAGFASVVGAVELEGNLSELPLIVVAGYSSGELVMTNEDGTKTQIWGLNMDSVLNRVITRIVDLGKGLVLTAEGQPEYLGKTVGEEMEAELEYMKINPDSTSKYDVKVANPSLEEKNMQYILDNGLPESYINDPNLLSEIVGKYIEPSKVYNFSTDWRMHVTECAAELDRTIEQIKDAENVNQVNLVAISHGGQVSSVYLAEYGYKKSVNNAVLTVPAIDGAVLALDIMKGQVKLDEYSLINYLQHGFMTEGQYHWLVEAQQLGFLDDIITELYPYVWNVIGNFGSIWDFIPSEDYEEVKAMHLDPVENAEIIRKSDYSHSITSNMAEHLQRCRKEYGINVSIIAGYGLPSVTGAQRQADQIISTNDATGATCAPFGLRFNDGYTGCKTECSDISHDHVSPSLEIDASSAYLPEHTWFIDKLTHGMTMKDPYTIDLCFNLLLTDNIEDVHSDPNYPQFRESSNQNDAVFLKFDKSPIGYISDEDNFLIVKNVSKEYPITIDSIKIVGADVTVHTFGIKAIQPGKEVKIELTGDVPDISNTLVQAQVKYSMQGNVTALIGEKTINFKTANGAPAVYDIEKPYVDADYISTYEELIPADTVDILTNLGMSAFLRYIVDMLMSVIKAFGFDVLFKI